MACNYKKINFIIIFVVGTFLIGGFCSAAFLKQDANNKINIQVGTAGDVGGYEISYNDKVYSLAQTIINAFLSLVGVILLAYLLSAGYKWMTAHGEEEKVTEAKDTIKRAIVGVIIIVGAYAISAFVMSRLEAGTLQGGSDTTTQSPTH